MKKCDATIIFERNDGYDATYAPGLENALALGISRERLEHYQAIRNFAVRFQQQEGEYVFRFESHSYVPDTLEYLAELPEEERRRLVEDVDSRRYTKATELGRTPTEIGPEAAMRTALDYLLTHDAARIYPRYWLKPLNSGNIQPLDGAFLRVTGRKKPKGKATEP